MAPIPEDNRDKPNNDEAELGNFSNPNLVMPIGGSDSSDNEDNEDNNNGAPHGYSLLPQDPGDFDDDDDSDAENVEHIDSAHDGPHISSSIPGNSLTVGGEGIPTDSLPETVLSSEAGASAPTVSVLTESCHPAFLAKFPDGKIPSYMQVPSVPRDKDGHLWNQQRQDAHKLPLDSAQESKILKAMSGFTLPSESIPEWAKHLPDDQWKQKVLSHIGNSSGRREQPGNLSVEQNTQPSEPSETKETTSSSDSGWVADFSDTDTIKQ